MKAAMGVFREQYDWLMAISRREAKNEVHSISAVASGLTADQSGRQRRYFISMMVRTACFILAVILHNPYRWIAIAGAVLLPYVAVVVANAGRETIPRESAIFNTRELQ